MSSTLRRALAVVMSPRVRSGGPHGGCRTLRGREEGFDRELADGRVERISEARPGADERELAISIADSERHRDLGERRAETLSERAAGVRGKFVVQRAQRRIAVRERFPSQAVEQLRAPLPE